VAANFEALRILARLDAEQRAADLKPPGGCPSPGLGCPARQALGQPFKYAEDLDAAAARCAAIAQQMAARQRDVASDTSPVATAQNSNAHEAEAEEIRRLITGPMAAHAPLAPPARAPSTRDTSRPPARAPTRPPRAPERRSR